MNRRSFLAGVGSLFAAPAIVHAGNLMPVKVIPFEPYMLLRGRHLLTDELHEVRIYDDASRVDSFISPDFFGRYIQAQSQFAGLPEEVGIAWSREGEKAMRMLEAEGTSTVAAYGEPLRLLNLSRSAPEPYAIDWNGYPVRK